MGRGGKREGAGKPKGAKNKKTLQREVEKALAAAGVDPSKAGEILRVPPEKLGISTMTTLTKLFMGMAAVYQPKRIEAGKFVDGNETKFLQYATLALDAANKLGPFESPKFSAVAIQQQMVNKIEVVGGMPDDFAPPVAQGGGQIIDIKPGTVITADDAAPTGPAEPPPGEPAPKRAASA